MHTINKNTVEGYRDEPAHTIFLIREMFNNHVINSSYATSKVNKELDNALARAEKALLNVYQTVDERYEEF